MKNSRLNANPLKVVYICGSGHSGSTLLAMMLGGHPMISSVGEVHRLFVNAHGIPKNNHSCTCGVTVLSCEFWQKVQDELNRILGTDNPALFKEFLTTDPWPLKKAGIKLTPYNQYLLPYFFSKSMTQAACSLGNRFVWNILKQVNAYTAMTDQAARNSILLYQAITQAWDTPIVLDSTKNLTRMKSLHFCAPDLYYVIHLVRDGRAVALSRKKRENMAFVDCARIWRDENRKALITLKSIPRERIFRIRYEDLCRETEAELSRICDFLGIEYTNKMLDFREPVWHTLGGNPMRFNHDSRIVLDEKWRNELDEAELAAFARIAGGINRKYNY